MSLRGANRRKKNNNFVIPHHTHDVSRLILTTFPAWDEWNLPLENTALQVRTWRQGEN